MNNLEYLESPSFLKNIGNGILLTSEEENMLKKYQINYQSCQNTKELLFKIEDYLNDFNQELEDLEKLSLRLSEYTYYYDTKK